MIAACGSLSRAATRSSRATRWSTRRAGICTSTAGSAVAIDPTAASVNWRASNPGLLGPLLSQFGRTHLFKPATEIGQVDLR